MKGQTIIRYGQALEIRNVHTIRCDQESVFDDSDTNLIGTKFTISAMGLVHVSTAAEQPQSLPINGDTATAVEKQIRQLAMTQRQRFEMVVGAANDASGGEVFLECDPAPRSNGRAPNLSNIDVNNGPRCLSLNVKRVNADVYSCEFTFEMTKAPECDANGGNPNNTGVLSVSFSVTDDVDQNFMTTRIWEGQVRTATARINPHAFRRFALPQLQLGMRRDKMVFTASPDGLLLNFTITDKETYASPPPPATSWAGGGLKVTYTTGDGKITYVDVSCGLRGDRFANRKLLITLATAIVESRLFAFEGQSFNPGQDDPIFTKMELFSISETIDNDEAVVFVSARGTRSVIGKNVNAVARLSLGGDVQATTIAGLASIGEDIPPEISQWDPVRHRGNWTRPLGGPESRRRGNYPETEGNISVTTALSTHLQTECTISRMVTDGVSAPKGGVLLNVKPTEIEKYKSPITEQQPKANRVGKEHKAHPYTTWIMQSKIHTNQHTVAMPIARFPATSPTDVPKPTVAHIALAPPSVVMTTRIDSVRIGDTAVLPEGRSFTDPETEIEFHFLDSKHVARVPGQTAAGDEKNVDSIELWFSLSRPPGPKEQLAIGVNPWDQLGVQRISDNQRTSISEFYGGSPIA